MKKIITKTIILSIMLVSYIQTSSAMNFDDVPQGFWAYREIDKLTNEKIISGYADNTYRPNELVTRAEYAVILIKALAQENLPIETIYTFDDLDVNHWAYKYVQQALNLDILKPSSDGKFYPNDYVTRSDVITFLVNILKTEQISKKDAIMTLQNTYMDFEDIPDWFKVTAGKAEVINVIAKEPPRQNYLDCDKYVTRAQMAVFIANMKRETDSYLAQKIKEEQSPKIAEGIIIENVISQGDVVTLPERTVLPIMIVGQLSTKDTKAGEMFQAKFVNNIVDYQHHLLLSKDIVLVGKVLESIESRNFVRNGEMIFELSAVNNKNLYTKILAVAEYEAGVVESNKIKKAAKTIIKGREFTVKDGQILYIRLFKPIRVNIVTQEVLD